MDFELCNGLRKHGGQHVTSQDDRVMWSAVVSDTAMVFFVRFLPTPTQCPFKALDLFNWPVVWLIWGLAVVLTEWIR